METNTEVMRNAASVTTNTKPTPEFFKTCRYLEKNQKIHLVLARPLFMDKTKTLKEGNLFHHPQVLGFITHRRHNDYGMHRYTPTEYEAVYEIEMVKLKSYMIDYRNCGFVFNLTFPIQGCIDAGLEFLNRLKAEVAELQSNEAMLGSVSFHN